MGLTSKLSYEAGHFSHHRKRHRFLKSEVLRLSFPSLEPSVAWSFLFPSSSSQFISTEMWDCQVLQLLPCYELSPPHLPVSVPPTSPDECFFFNSLVVGLPYSSIFWQFWLFFVFKFVVHFLVMRGGKSVSTYTSVLARSQKIPFFCPSSMLVSLAISFITCI